MNGVTLVLRAVQIFLAVVTLGLAAYVANWYNVDTLTTSPPQINFMIFAPAFSLLSLVYLEAVPRFASRLSIPYVALALEALNTLFFFAAFVAMSVFLSKLLFCRGMVCASARAATVIGSFEFALWTATAVLMGRDLMRGGAKRGGAATGATFRGPNMHEKPFGA